MIAKTRAIEGNRIDAGRLGRILVEHGGIHRTAECRIGCGEVNIEGIEAGNVSINTLEASLPETPFGGVKSSGYGREGGTEGLLNYMITKNVSHSLSIV